VAFAGGEPLSRNPGRRRYRDLMSAPEEREDRSKPLLRTMVGDVLRRTRRDQGRTLADVAADAKVSMPYLSEVERGRKEASSELLAAICEALDLPMSEVLREVSDEMMRVEAAAVGALTELRPRESVRPRDVVKVG
jgi:transcriptional regulator with XRE-family HTH domain